MARSRSERECEQRDSSRAAQTRIDVTYPLPGRSCSKRPWRSEAVGGEKSWDERWIGVKVLSNISIAGSPRNAFWCSVAKLTGGGRATEWAGSPHGYPA